MIRDYDKEINHVIKKKKIMRVHHAHASATDSRDVFVYVAGGRVRRPLPTPDVDPFELILPRIPSLYARLLRVYGIWEIYRGRRRTAFVFRARAGPWTGVETRVESR